MLGAEGLKEGEWVSVLGPVAALGMLGAGAGSPPTGPGLAVVPRLVHWREVGQRMAAQGYGNCMLPTWHRVVFPLGRRDFWGMGF